MMQEASTPRRDEGFTLIELVVALALAGVISLLLLHGINLATVGLDRLSRKAEQLDERRGVDAVLRHALAAASAAPAPDGEPGFSGTPNRLSFLSLAEDSGPGLYRIEISLDRGRDDRALMFTRRLAERTATSRTERSVLVPGVRELRIAYFGADTISSQPAWHDSWEEISYLPKLVRLTLAGNDGAVRPPIVVRVWNGG